MKDINASEILSFEIMGETVNMAYLPRNGFIIREIFQDQCYRPVPFIKGVVNILDIGANIGAASIFFRFTYPQARIHAFEPGHGAFDMLAQNVAPYPSIIAHKFGLWHCDQTAELFVGDHDYATASLADPEGGNRASDRIDLKACGAELLKLGVKSVDIAKIDTEGCEIPIIKDLIANYAMRVIYLEFHSEEDRFAIEDLLRTEYSLFSADIQHLHRGTLCYVSRSAIARDSDYHHHRIVIDND